MKNQIEYEGGENRFLHNVSHWLDKKKIRVNCGKYPLQIKPCNGTQIVPSFKTASFTWKLEHDYTESDHNFEDKDG